MHFARPSNQIAGPGWFWPCFHCHCHTRFLSLRCRAITDYCRHMVMKNLINEMGPRDKDFIVTIIISCRAVAD